jgi:hypothetical protein
VYIIRLGFAIVELHVDSIVVVAVQMSFKGGCGVRWGIYSFEGTGRLYREIN